MVAINDQATRDKNETKKTVIIQWLIRAFQHESDLFETTQTKLFVHNKTTVNSNISVKH